MGKGYNIGELPFYYTALLEPSNPEDLPNKLMFALAQDDNGIIRQMPSENEENFLNIAYQKGSQISGLMDEHGIGRLYADDFIKYISKGEPNIFGKKILEIGCGNGYLLHELQKLGGKVFGIEPGIHGIDGKEKWGVPILTDFFNPNKITERYDIVIFYAVLEHIRDTKKFLQDVKSILNSGGKIFLAVPDCEPYIKMGDISILIHEHWSYFTRDTLEILVKKNGLTGEIVNSKFAGALYAQLYAGGGIVIAGQ